MSPFAVSLSPITRRYVKEQLKRNQLPVDSSLKTVNSDVTIRSLTVANNKKVCYIATEAQSTASR